MNETTASEYLIQRSFLGEDSRKMLRMALVRWLVDAMSSWKTSDVWKSDIVSRVNAIVAENEAGQRLFVVGRSVEASVSL